ncbi:MAG TPA: tetratricopeptide repeat protein [Candidatus Acidoferrales bacterium]|nr:tetratricopeptide repeat protein [Candidatus Acidoferrales bacterium]
MEQTRVSPLEISGVTGFLICLLLVVAVAAAGQDRTETANSITAALRARDFQQALQVTRSALQAAPNDPQFLTMEGLALSGLGEDHGALAAYDSALNVAPNYLPALEGAAQIEYHTGSERAARLLNRILKIQPNDETSHAMLAVLAYRRHDCKAAIEHFQSSGKVLFSQPPALEEYGFCLVQAGRAADAVNIYRNLVSLSPQDSRARIHLAAAQFLADEPHDALTTLDPILQQTDTSAEALDIASNAAEKIGDTPRAVQFLREAIVRNPRNADYYLDFATLAFDHSSFQVGIDMLNVGLSHIPNSAPLYLARGVLRVQVGQYDKGESDFETAQRLDPRQAFSSESESLAKLQQKGAGNAVTTVRSRLKEHPNDPVLLYLLADALAQNGAQAGSPEFAEALHAAERAVELRPTLVLGRDLLSKLYYDDGQLAPAIRQCRVVLRSDPTDQEALYRLVQALRKTRKTAEIPELLKRLASLREKDRKMEASHNRYKLVEPEPAAVSRE